MGAFKDKVLSMTAEEIVMNMVNALREPMTEIDMDSFGRVVGFKGEEITCFGCAATNSISRLINSTDWLYKGRDFGIRDRSLVDGDLTFVRIFELAMNSLRAGHLYDANTHLESIGAASLNIEGRPALPFMDSDYTSEDLDLYEFFARMQRVENTCADHVNKIISSK